MDKSIIFKAMKRILIIKVLFILLSAHLLFSPLSGHPVWGEKIILSQPSGITIVGYIYGDEFHRRIETEGGYTIILNEETGTIEYALLENNKLVPSGMVAGVVSTSYLEMINFPKHLTDRKYKIVEIRKKSPERFHELEPLSQKEIKIQALAGTKKVFVVCVEFQSETSPPTEWSSGEFSPSGFDTRLFSAGASDISMSNYYKSNSYNAEHKLLKTAVRANLLPVIAFSFLVVNFGPAATAVVLVFMLVFPILFIRFYPGKVKIL
jgi:hypothetical protein